MAFVRACTAKAKSRMGIGILALMLIVVASGLSACAVDPLTELERFQVMAQDPAGVEINFCTRAAEVIQTRTKYVFIIDKSGSNGQNYRLNPDGSIAMPLDIQMALATDPQGLRRYPQLLSFLAQSPANDPLKYYSLINFSTNATTVRGFTSDRVSFEATVSSQYSNLSDQGATNYLGALDAAYNLINSDISRTRQEANPVASTYIIVFISDGFPIISLDGSTNPPTVNAQEAPAIIQRVRNILALQSDPRYVDNISVFTGYYYVTGNEDPNARQLLADMANVGNGVAYTFGTDQVVDFSLFQVPDKVIKYALSEVIVENVSTNWHEGALEGDTDGDGLTNSFEALLGSDPTRADSDLNGVSDYVETRTSANSQPCASIIAGRCQPGGARPYYNMAPGDGGCNTVSRTSVNPVTFADTDRDGLNDCEELVVGNAAGLNDFDSNGDSIPDGLAYRSAIDFKAGTSPAKGDIDLDLVTNFNEIKFDTPVSFTNDRVLGLTPVKYDLRIVSGSGLQDCYQLKVSDLQAVGPNNLLRVSIMENTPVIVNRRVFRIAEKRFSGDSKFLTINEDEAGVWR